MDQTNTPNREILQYWQDKLTPIGQQHVLHFWHELSQTQRTELLADLQQLPSPAALAELVRENVVHYKPPRIDMDRLQPAPCLPATPGMDQVGQYADAVKLGVRLIQDGRVAALTVAGGQGTRLGFSGPKGVFPISPVKNKPLFQLFAEHIRGTELRYGSGPIPWYLMTSPVNDQETRQFFTKAGYFGLQPGQVHFFTQGVMPAFSPEGKILMASRSRLALSPDGHGGTLLALRRRGCLDQMAAAGVEHISYFQVDNPLVYCIDPLFIGLHAARKSQMSSKMLEKADDFERVGNFCLSDGKVLVVEYSDLPKDLAIARNPDGSRRFNAGSIAIHVLSRQFVEDLTADEARFKLPWHRAVKKVPCINLETGETCEPSEPNGTKLETFIFDAIPMAANPMILQTLREEEFSPVKNATGTDSVATSRRDQTCRAARWLSQAGVRVPHRPDGQPDAMIEISPLLALDSEHLREKLRTRPEIVPGGQVYLAG
jgi:UDP-N-acetylglucosamine/UDP-N-acetylgalactosamine diphosphorylase